MRSIKFRAWDVTAKYMTAPFELGSLNAGDGFEFDWKVMQFTGQCDRDGREIYEGDIVCRRPGDVAIVEYDASTTRFVLNPDRYGEAEDGWGSVSVLGNIYENADLLPKSA